MFILVPMTALAVHLTVPVIKVRKGLTPSSECALPGAHKKACCFQQAFKFNLGGVLLSHTVAHAVPSALKGLTSVFGMGTGVSPSPWSPRNL